MTIATKDAKSMKTALAWAREAYDKLVTEPKPKEEKKEEDIPVCAVHNVAMVKQNGKYGQFWSCHERNPDGSFCSYRPKDR